MQMEELNTDDIASVEAFMEANMGLAIKVASKYFGRGNLDREDLKQEAMYGLYLATMRYKPSRGYKFSTFAVPTINGTVLKYIRDKETLIRIPRDKKRDFYKYRARVTELGELEARKELGYTDEYLEELNRIDQLINQVSLNRQVGYDTSKHSEIQDLLECGTRVEDETLAKTGCEEIKDIVYEKLGRECYQIVEMLSEGFEKIEIREEMGISAVVLNNRLTKIQEELKKSWLKE